MRLSRSVLLAEDHEDTLRVYSIILRHYGYEVIEARSGVEAVELARKLQPQLVLMDIGLPGLDGWQASRILKGDPKTAAIPVIAFSARIVSTADLGGRASFDGYILKPIGPRDLVRRVDAYMKLLGDEQPFLGSAPAFGVLEDPDAQREMTT